MDAGLLQAIVAEAGSRLIEQEIHRVAHLGASRYLLRFATPGHDNLLVSVRPVLPRLHLMPRGGGHHEAPPDRFAALADGELAGARLTALEAPAGERVVRMRFRVPRAEGGPAERELVAELFGRSANLILLDGAGIVLGAARDLRSAFRAPIAGEPYRPPVPREAAPTGPGDGGSTGAVVLSPRPLDDYREGDQPGRDAIRVVAGTVAAGVAGPDGAPLCVTEFAGPSAAAAAAFALIERLRDFGDERAHHQAVVRRECARLEVLTRRLEEDLARARGGDRHRRWAEALLAGLRAARVEGATADVPDPESVDGARMEVPIDPALSLQANAERHFALWKKGKRGEATILTRQEAVRRRLGAWAALAPRAEAVSSAADLEGLRQAMAGLGMVHAAPRPRRAAAPARREEPTRVRRHTTDDGFVVLVGRSGPENDRLTFRVASPWDFWLHAAGLPGAHVIVRNPARLKSIPVGALRAAAGIAAWYSGARGDGKVEVHYTQRKHVRKRKGMPAGQVLVRHFRSIQVAPRLPRPPIEEV